MADNSPKNSNQENQKSGELVPVESETARQKALGLTFWTSPTGQRAYVKLSRQVPIKELESLLLDIGVEAELMLDQFKNEEAIEEKIDSEEALIVAERDWHLSDIVFDLDFELKRDIIFEHLQLQNEEKKRGHKKLPLIEIPMDECVARRRTPEEIAKRRELVDVFGKVSLTEKPMVPIVVGQGLEENEDGEILTVLPGRLVIRGNNVSIDNKFIVNSTEDWFEGKLSFVGTVEIGKEIVQNFDINAGQDILIKGSSETSNLKATEKIIINEGIIGQMESTARANELIKSRYVNQGKLFCAHDIDVKSGVFHSIVHAHGTLSVDRGPIVGGENYGAYGVLAQKLGAASGVKTLIMAGYCNPIPYSLDKVEEEISELDQQLAKLIESVRPQMALASKGDRGAKIKLTSMTKEIKRLKFRRTELQNWLDDHDIDAVERAKIEVSGTVFPGVTVVVNNYRHEVTELTRKVIFRADKEKQSLVVKRL